MIKFYRWIVITFSSTQKDPKCVCQILCTLRRFVTVLFLKLQRFSAFSASKILSFIRIQNKIRSLSQLQSCSSKTFRLITTFLLNFSPCLSYLPLPDSKLRPDFLSKLILFRNKNVRTKFAFKISRIIPFGEQNPKKN